MLESCFPLARCLHEWLDVPTCRDSRKTRPAKLDPNEIELGWLCVVRNVTGDVRFVTVSTGMIQSLVLPTR